jgi:hypothetical protein
MGSCRFTSYKNSGTFSRCRVASWSCEYSHGPCSDLRPVVGSLADIAFGEANLLHLDRLYGVEVVKNVLKFSRPLSTGFPTGHMRAGCSIDDPTGVEAPVRIPRAVTIQ